jgi:hypothetical protein
MAVVFSPFALGGEPCEMPRTSLSHVAGKNRFRIDVNINDKLLSYRFNYIFYFLLIKNI